MMIFLTLRVCLSLAGGETVACGDITLPKVYDSVDACSEDTNKAISKWAEAHPYMPLRSIKPETCGPNGPGEST